MNITLPPANLLPREAQSPEQRVGHVEAKKFSWISIVKDRLMTNEKSAEKVVREEDLFGRRGKCLEKLS